MANARGTSEGVTSPITIVSRLNTRSNATTPDHSKPNTPIHIRHTQQTRQEKDGATVTTDTWDVEATLPPQELVELTRFLQPRPDATPHVEEMNVNARDSFFNPPTHKDREEQIEVEIRPSGTENTPLIKRAATKPPTAHIDQGWPAWLLTHMLGAVAAAPTAINALLMISGEDAKEIGKQWWERMGIVKQLFSLLNASASEYVNTNLNAKFFSEAWEKICNIMRELSNAFKILLLVTSVFFGFFGGLAASAIAYEAFAFLGGAAVIFAAFNLLVFFTSRYLGVNKLLGRINHRAATQAQQEAIDKLGHLKAEYTRELQAAIDTQATFLLTQNAKTTLSKDDFEKIFEVCCATLSRLARENDDVFHAKTSAEYTAEYARTLFDILFASIVAVFSLITFTQKGYKGVSTLIKLISGTSMDDHLPFGLKMPIGLLGGFPSQALYANSALNFSQLFTDAAIYVYQHPKQAPKFFLDLFTNALATLSMYNVGAGIPGPKNVFGIPLTAASYWLFSLSSAAGALAVNFGPTLAEYAPKPDPTHPSLNDVKEYFHNPAIHPITPDTAIAIRRLSLFAPPLPREGSLQKPPSIYPLN